MYMGNKTFRYFASSPPGRFATWTFRHLDVSHLWTFRYQDISLIATSMDVSPSDDKDVLTVSQLTNFQTVAKTSREVAKRPSIETSKGAKRPGGELAK